MSRPAEHATGATERLVDVFVYFKAPSDARAAVERCVRAVIERMRRTDPAPARCRVSVRADATDAVQTWLETYEGIAESSVQAWLIALQVAVDAAGLEAQLAGPRHVEVFRPLGP